MDQPGVEIKEPSKIVKIGGGFLLFAFVLAGIGSLITPTTKPQEPSVETRPLSDFKAAPVINKIKPESIVVFPKSGVACLGKDALLEITAHALKGEATKANAMMLNPKTGNGQCIMLSPGKRYKVISSEYNVETLDIGILELVGDGNMSGNGAWAYTTGAEVIR